MKVLMLSYEFPPLGGGGSTVVYNLAKEVVKAGNEVDVVTMGFKGLDRFEQIDGINVYRVRSIRTKKEVCYTPEMLTYVLAAIPVTIMLHAKKRYDINHTHFIMPTGFISFVLRVLCQLPFIVTSHGSDVLGYHQKRFRFGYGFLGPFWKMIIKASKCVVTPSEFLKNRILDAVPEIKIEVIPNGFDSTTIIPMKKEKKILAVTRLFENKGVQHLIDAVRDMDFDYEINIVGDGPFKEALLEKAQGSKATINFLGWIERDSEVLQNLYAESSIFVFPSYFESFGMVILEAMAGGQAIITTDVGGVREAVGDAAIFVRSKSQVDIKKALLRLVRDSELRRNLGVEARKRVQSEFAWDSIAHQYTSLYNEIVKEHTA